jgi:hypothetical protein
MSTVHSRLSFRRPLAEALRARSSVFTLGALAALGLGTSGCETEVYPEPDPCDGYSTKEAAELAMTPYWRQCLVTGIQWRDENNNVVPSDDLHDNIRTANQIGALEQEKVCADSSYAGTVNALAWCIESCQVYTPNGYTDNCDDAGVLQVDSAVNWLPISPDGQSCKSYSYVLECNVPIGPQEPEPEPPPPPPSTVTCFIDDKDNMLGIKEKAAFFPETLCGAGSQPNGELYEFCLNPPIGGYRFDAIVDSDESKAQACQAECGLLGSVEWFTRCSNCSDQLNNCELAKPVPDANGDQADPLGAGLLWSTAAGRVTAPLACDLNQTCCTSFESPACKNLEYGRVFQPAATSSAQLAVVAMLESGGVETRASFSGVMTFSLASCSNPAGTCPIYIESLELVASDPISGVWDDGTRTGVAYSVSDMALSLVKPTMGAQHATTRQFQLAPDALRIRFEGDFRTRNQSLVGPLSLIAAPQGVTSGFVSATGSVTLYGQAEMAPGVYLTFEGQSL